jgi:hypothetical protein
MSPDLGRSEMVVAWRSHAAQAPIWSLVGHDLGVSLVSGTCVVVGVFHLVVAVHS